MDKLSERLEDAAEKVARWGSVMAQNGAYDGDPRTAALPALLREAAELARTVEGAPVEEVSENWSGLIVFLEYEHFTLGQRVRVVGVG